jgi:hypothetical protein
MHATGIAQSTGLFGGAGCTQDASVLLLVLRYLFYRYSCVSPGTMQ